ncbi:MAG: helix-turn-helix domain-containing protein [Paludibacteraceae bacterium]|nr:helix-turn-helix domain-containing protein [Paludibacteraceae bacterium]
MEEDQKIPLLDCPVDFLIGDASGKIMNEYGRFPCKIKCGVYAFMVKGSAKATINITKYDFRQNDVLLLEPGSFLLIHEFSEDALVYYILFSSSFLSKHTFGSSMSLDAMQLRNPIVHISDEQGKVIQSMTEVLMQASNTQPSMLNSENMVHIFNLLQSSYSRFAKRQDNYLIRPLDRKTAIYQEYTRLVLNHYTEWHQVSQYAEEMRLTLPHLCSTIKQVCNKTAGDLINEAILTDAKAQLKLTSLQVKEIAMSLGFENVAFFNRFFKMHTKMTPKAYRAMRCM